MFWPALQDKSNLGITSSSTWDPPCDIYQNAQREDKFAEGTSPVLWHPGGNEGAVMACTVSVGEEEMAQAVRNLHPWARACLIRMGAAFEVGL